MARFTRVLFLLAVSGLMLVSVLRASLPQIATGKWANSGSLAQARSGAAAVLLPDGRVMITGGDVNGSPSSSVEVFNPDGSISSAAPMSTARTGHSAFVLTSGEVLVTGGRTGGGGITNSAELYDPFEDVWIAAPAMQDARTGHTVLQLPDWTVIVVGGINSSGPVSGVERYSPATNSFSHAGVLNHARTDAAAAVLDDGRVLIAGGIMADGTASASTEIFDPVTGASSDAAVLSTARAGASATTLFDGRIAVIGGNDGSNDLASAEIYDPAAAAWTVVAGLTARSHHLAIPLPYNNSVLLTGGSAGTATDLFIPWGNSDQGAFVSTSASGTSHNAGFGAPLGAEGLLLAGGGDAGAGTELFRFATVRTDRDDYVPGQTVTITGTGWKPGEQVTIALLESPNIDTHAPITATADANGNIADSGFATDQHDFQVRFFVFAHGAASDAATSFTDGGGAVAVAGVSSTTATTFSYTGYSDSTCTTIAGGQGQSFPKSITVTGNASATLGLGNANFFKVTIPTDPAGFRFNNWSNAATGTSRTTGCVAAGSGANTTTVQANLVPATVNTTLTLAVIPGSVSFGTTAPVSLQATLNDSSNNPIANASITFTVNGVSQTPASTTNASGVATFSYNPSALPASITAYPVNASFSAAVIGGVSYLASSANGSLAVVKATPVIAWPTPADITYGTALSGTQLSATASSNGNPVAGAFAYTPAAGTVLNAGNGQTLTADFVPADTTDYNSVSGTTVHINVLRATPTITVTDPAPTYDGTAKTASATATGVNGAAVSGTFAFTYKDSSSNPIASPTNAGTYSVTASFTSSDSNYNNAAATGTLTIQQATLAVTVSGGPFTFDGSAHAATIAVTGVGGATVSGSSAVTYNGSTTVPANAGTYAVAVNFTSSDANYANASGTGSIQINKADSITVVTITGGATFTYDGTAHPATVSVTGAGGLNLTPDPVYSCGHAPINVSDSGCTASYNYAGDANHNPSSDSKTYTINKATPLVTVSGGPFTYDGSAHAATITVTGVGGATVSGSSAVTYNGLATVPTNAGTYAVAVTFTSADGNYDNASGSGSILVNKANSTTVVSVAGGVTFTYDGNAHPATVSVTGAGGLSLTPDPVYSCGHAPINVSDSGCTASYNYAGDDNHNPSSDSKTYTINKATPLVTVNGGPFTFDGSAHAATIAVSGIGGATVIGSSGITYNGVATVPSNAGTYAVAVIFTSADNNYDNATGSGSILINKATSTTVVSGTFTFTYDGNAHPATVSVTGAGGLSLTPDPLYSCGHAPINVTDSGCTASYNYAGDDNHNPSSDSKTYTISKASPLVTVTGGTFTFDGNAHPAGVTVTGIGGVNVPGTVALTYNGSAAVPVDAGVYAVAVKFTSADGNYDNATGSGSITINQAPSVTTVSGVFTFTYDGNAHPATVSVTGAGGLSQTPAPVYSCGHVPINASDSGCIASYSYPGDTNHTGSSDSKTYSISKALPVLTVNPLTPVTIGNAVTISGTVKLSSLIPTGTVAVTVNGITQTATIGAGGAFSTTFAAGTIGVGSYSATAVYSGDTNFLSVTSVGSSFAVQYNVCLLYDSTKSVKSGATYPVKLYLCDASGRDLSSTGIILHATLVTISSVYSGAPEDAGNSNPDLDFRYDSTLGPSGGYIFNLKTTGLGSGTYNLNFTAGTDPVTHSVPFGVK
jgi:Big-like domain-containing protein/MBG domain-containing protein/Kelch motif protein